MPAKLDPELAMPLSFRRPGAIGKLPFPIGPEPRNAI
jgi:hypothetical protein